MHIKQTHLIAWLIILAGCISCNRSEVRERIITDSAGRPSAVYLSQSEMEDAGILFGTLSEQNMDRWISCSGYMILVPVRPVVISARASGIIRSVHFSPGDFIRAGAVLGNYESPEVLRLQQEYLEAENQVEYLREDYKRQGELTVENATSVKKMQMARRDFQGTELKLKALQTQLEYYGIVSDSLQYDRFDGLIEVKVSESGYLQDIRVRPGSYIMPGDKLATLVNSYQKLLKINIHERYLPLLQKNQIIEFNPLCDSLSVYQTKVHALPDKVDPASHSATFFAAIPGTMACFLPGMSVRTRIRSNKHMVPVVPSGAVLHKPDGDFLFVMSNGKFTRISVRTGESNGGVTEIDGFPADIGKDSVVIKGSDYLEALFEQ